MLKAFLPWLWAGFMAESLPSLTRGVSVVWPGGRANPRWSSGRQSQPGCGALKALICALELLLLPDYNVVLSFFPFSSERTLEAGNMFAARSACGFSLTRHTEAISLPFVWVRVACAGSGLCFLWGGGGVKIAASPGARLACLPKITTSRVCVFCSE